MLNFKNTIIKYTFEKFTNTIKNTKVKQIATVSVRILLCGKNQILYTTVPLLHRSRRTRCNPTETQTMSRGSALGLCCLGRQLCSHTDQGNPPLAAQAHVPTTSVQGAEDWASPTAQTGQNSQFLAATGWSLSVWAGSAMPLTPPIDLLVANAAEEAGSESGVPLHKDTAVLLQCGGGEGQAATIPTPQITELPFHL